jgi:hypothetical protein
MFRLFCVAFLSVGALAQCKVCLNGGAPRNPNVILDESGGFTCSYFYSNADYLRPDGQQCIVVQKQENQAACACPGVSSPVSVTPKPPTPRPTIKRTPSPIKPPTPRPTIKSTPSPIQPPTPRPTIKSTPSPIKPTSPRPTIQSTFSPTKSVTRAPVRLTYPPFSRITRKPV